MSRLIKHFYPGAIEFVHIRIVSMLSYFGRSISNFFLRTTHTLPMPSSIEADVEDLPFFDKVYNFSMSALRRVQDIKKQFVPKVKISEPEKQILLWDNATKAKADLSNFIFQFFTDLSELQPDIHQNPRLQ